MSANPLTIDYIDSKTKHEFHLPLTLLSAPCNSDQYCEIELYLDKLIDEVRDNEFHPLALAMQIMGTNLEKYDDQHNPAIGENVSDIDMVKYLMEVNNLNQKDLSSIFGNQGNVSKFLNGERSLSKLQIVGLKKRFLISADFFLRC